MLIFIHNRCCFCAASHQFDHEISMCDVCVCVVESNKNQWHTGD